MKLDTVVKFGSLAFEIAKDEKVREMVTMVHHGARRRGLLGQVPGQAATSTHTGGSEKSSATSDASATPEASVKSGHGGKAAAASADHGAGHPIPFSPLVTQSPVLPEPLRRYFTTQTARRVGHWAAMVKDLLVK
jgi:hypothetical protein